MPSQRRVRDAAEIVDLVEDLADHVERRGEVRAADAEEDAHGLADLGLQRMELRERADRAVEDEVFRAARSSSFSTLNSWLPCWPNAAVGVDLALHDVELVVDRRQARLGLDQDQAVHAVGDVLGDHRRGAVVDVEARAQRLERHRFLVAGIDLQRRGAAAGTGRAWKSTEWIILLSAEFFRWTSTVSPTRTRTNGPGTLPLKVQ